MPLPNSTLTIHPALLNIRLTDSIVHYFVDHSSPQTFPAPGCNVSLSSDHSPDNPPIENCLTVSSNHCSFVYHQSSLALVSWLDDHTAIRFSTSSPPHPLSPYVTQVVTDADRVDYAKHSSQVKETEGITPTLSPFNAAAMHQRPQPDMFAITEASIIYPTNVINQYVTPDVVYVAPSWHVETTYSSWDGISPSQITAVGENKTDDEFSDPKSLLSWSPTASQFLNVRQGGSFSTDISSALLTCS